MVPQKDSFSYRRLRQVIRSVDVVLTNNACTIEMEPNTDLIEANRQLTTQTTPALTAMAKQVIEEAGMPCVGCNPVLSPVRPPRIIATLDRKQYDAALAFAGDFEQRKLQDSLKLNQHR